MKKGIKTRKLGRTSNERKQLFRNLMRSVVLHGYVDTSEAKAKAVKPIFEKLISAARGDTLVHFRKVISQVGDVEIAKEVMKLGDLFAKRPGGYTRLIRMGAQAGDNTQVVRLELVEKLAVAETIAPKKTTEAVQAKEVKKEVTTKKIETKPKSKKMVKVKKS